MGLLILDQYSLLHFVVGIVVYFWGFSFWHWTIIHILFELTENTNYGMYIINKYLILWPGGKTYADNMINSTGDVLVGCMGWVIAKWIDHIGRARKWIA